MSVTGWYGTDSMYFLQNPEDTGMPGPARPGSTPELALAPILGEQLVGSAVSFQGFLGVGVLRQLGLAACKRTVLLRIFLCLELKTQWSWLHTKLSEKGAHF